MKELVRNVKHFICQHHLLKEHARVVVGLSGGPDSVCLATTLHRLGYDIVAAHCNFHLRGEESLRDEQFVTALCRQQGWTLRTTDFDTAAYAREHRLSIETAARELRYDWFRTLKDETGAEAIAVGHHKDDNAETMLLHLARGAGIKGLCGMQPRNGDVVRPLLCLTRQDIAGFLADEHLAYVTDHTNLEDAYARNKVRLDVMPVLERINKGAQHNIVSAMENLNEVQKVYRQAMDAALQACCTHQPNGELHIGIQPLRQQPSPLAVLHEVLAPGGFNRQQLKDILAALGESGRTFSANGRRLLIDRTSLILESPHYSTPTIQQEVLPAAEVCIQKDPRLAYLDADRLHGELTLRTPLAGDTFAPFGMHGRRKLLSDFLTDLKLNLFEKERQPLLMDGNEIVWVVGRRSSDLYRVDAHTQNVVVLKSL